VTWLRIGDNAAHHPIALQAHEVEHCDERLVNELFGFVVRCATLSAAFQTDYVVSRGTALLLGGSRAELLITAAQQAGYFVEVVDLGGTGTPGRIGYKLVDDEPEFIHMRLKAEVEWDRQRGRDTSNTMLIVPIRLRDGDVCRYCGKTVGWFDRKSARGGTYDRRHDLTHDHRRPKEPATVETMVVACRSCNAKRSDDPEADSRVPLLPPPTNPYYTPKTAAWLATFGHDVTPGALVPAGDPPPGATPRSAPPAEPAPRDPAPSGTTRPPAADQGQGRISGSFGSGPGRVGSGREAEPVEGAPRRRRRGRRGRRGGTSPPPGGDPPCPPLS